MTIYGLSQTSGIERLLDVEPSDGALLMHVHDRPADPGERVVVPTGDVVAALTDGQPGVKAIEASAPGEGAPRRLELEVRGNEVWLTVRADGAAGTDIAVGFDDFQDAVEAAA